MKILAAAAVSIALIGCTSEQTRQQYYDSVAQTNQSLSAEAQARYNALAQMAKHGDPATAGAAVMALALSGNSQRVVAPQAPENDALEWAKVVAGPTAAVLGLYIQADASKDIAANNTRVALARETTSQVGMQTHSDTILGVATSGGAGTEAAVNGLIQLGTAGINGINQMGVAGLSTASTISGQGVDGLVAANDNLVELGTAGLDTASSIASTGFTTVESVATTGFESTVDLGTLGIQTTADVGVEGMTQINSMGQAGYDFGSTVVTQSYDWSQFLVSEYPIVVNPEIVTPVIVDPVVVDPVVIEPTAP